MAITSLAAVGGLSASLSYLDFTGRQVTAGLLLPAAVTLANAQTFLLALAQACEAASDCQISGANVSVRYNTTGADPAIQGNYAEDKGVFGIRTAAGKTVRYSIPGLANSLLLGQTRDIDLTDPLVSAITTLLITGNGTVAPVDSNASDLVQVLYGKLRQRNELTQA
ncbi:MAG: hypothetical protein HC893_00010 [Chloroflexaceae bacterium]|nr:hypothetical protein [Chloroflexaceae bacterium]